MGLLSISSCNIEKLFQYAVQKQNQQLSFFMLSVMLSFKFLALDCFILKLTYCYIRNLSITKLHALNKGYCLNNMVGILYTVYGYTLIWPLGSPLNYALMKNTKKFLENSETLKFVYHTEDFKIAQFDQLSFSQGAGLTVLMNLDTGQRP